MTRTRQPAIASAEVLITVPFYDVDMMRVVWHGHYVKYCERARCALLDKLQYNYSEMEASGYLWPIVDLHLKYVRSARFNRVLRVRASLTEYENRLGMEYLITDEETGERLTKATSVQVAVELKTGEMWYVSPPILLEKVRCFIEG
jgi:acyl-CoA thioester hydrolase